jgi:Trk K+ transport system NAD-binding subunit
VQEIEALFLPARVAVYQIMREGKLFEPTQEMLLSAQDTLIVAGKYVGLISAPEIIGWEVNVSMSGRS